MKLAIMQPYFFPYIGYFQCISAVDKYIVYDDLNFIYQGWVDRNRLVDKSGQVFYIRPQLDNASVSKLISETRFQQKQFWRSKLLKTLTLSYAGAAHFDETYLLIKKALDFETDLLSDFNFNAIRLMCDFLEIDTVLEKQNERYKQLENSLKSEDLSAAFPDIRSSELEVKVIRAISVCRQENATTFVNAIGGMELYGKSAFKTYDIDVKFVKTGTITYRQFASEFSPGLSIIDVLMHNGKEGTKQLLNQYELV